MSYFPGVPVSDHMENQGIIFGYKDAHVTVGAISFLTKIHISQHNHPDDAGDSVLWTWSLCFERKRWETRVFLELLTPEEVPPELPV